MHVSVCLIYDPNFYHVISQFYDLMPSIYNKSIAHKTEFGTHMPIWCWHQINEFHSSPSAIRKHLDI